MQIPDTLAQEVTQNLTVPTIDGFINMSDKDICDYHKKVGFAMSEKDLIFVRDYFKGEKRDPSESEIKVIHTYWSDHCRHTTFSTHIDGGEIENPRVKEAYYHYLKLRAEVYGEKAKERPETLMDIATIAAKALKKRGLLPELDESEEINACSIHVPAEVDGEIQDWLLMFKNETHNHPTEIEPFGGAATCIGGCIRDPLSGRAYVHQAMRLTGCRDPRTPAQALSDCRRGLLLLRQSDRPCHGSCCGALSSRLRGQASGSRRGCGSGSGGECAAGTACPWRCRHSFGRAHRTGRHRRRYRVLQEP